VRGALTQHTGQVFAYVDVEPTLVVPGGDVLVGSPLTWSDDHTVTDLAENTDGERRQQQFRYDDAGRLTGASTFGGSPSCPRSLAIGTDIHGIRMPLSSCLSLPVGSPLSASIQSSGWL
jgi:YD repeat-containing protein